MLLDREYVWLLVWKGLFKRSFHLAHAVHPAGGTALEFGVFRGSSYIYQADQIRHRYPGTRLIGFDSWSGLPAETPGIWTPKVHAQGRFRAGKDVVLRRMKRAGLDPEDTARFRFVDGLYQDSLTRALQGQIADVIFVNIDCDMHKSTLGLLDFIKPLLRPGTILYWDDWSSPMEKHAGEWGEHLAWREWCTANPDVKTDVVDVNWLEQRTMLVTVVGDRALTPEQIDAVHARYRQLESIGLRAGRRLLGMRILRPLLRLFFGVSGALRAARAESALARKGDV